MGAARKMNLEIANDPALIRSAVIAMRLAPQDRVRSWKRFVARVLAILLPRRFFGAFAGSLRDRGIRKM